MGWFTLISEKETFFINGREIVIRYKYPEDLVRFKPFRFIREYERCVEMRRKQPVLSVTSGKGILDYKKMLSDLKIVIPKL